MSPVSRNAMQKEPQPKSLKAKRDRATQSTFIGREAQLTSFRSTMATPEDQRQTVIFGISGQGGIGKTTLLKQFRRIAEELKGVTAYVDEGSTTNRVDTVPEVLSRWVADFEKQGLEFKKFQERYKVYRQKKQELEADPEAPQGLVVGMTKFATKAAIGAAKSVPGSGMVTTFMDEEGLANQAGGVASYLAKKLTNKDEVQLLTEPLEILTPLFLQDLNRIAERQTVVLLLDTYEQTGEFLDDWLRAMLDDRYSESVHPNCLICIAGRDPLSRNAWTDWEDLIARSELEPFTEEEARRFLAGKQVTDEAVVQEIWRLSSGGLPILIAMLAENAPSRLEQVSDRCEQAVERFLKWEKEEKNRKILLGAALPRLLNRDVLAVLTSEAEAEERFGWLKGRSFVLEYSEGWRYHGIVREQMMRCVRRVSQREWAGLHGKLAEFYEGLRRGLGLVVGQEWQDETWRGYTLEWLYHSLCEAPQRQLGMALNGGLAVLRELRKFAAEWAEVMVEAGRAVEYMELRQWGESLWLGLQKYDEADYIGAVEVFSIFLKAPQLEDAGRAVVLGERGRAYQRMQRYEEALLDFNRAMELDESYGWAIIQRGEIYRKMQRYEEALLDFNRAMELDESYGWAIIQRGETYRLLKRYEEALADFNQVIELTGKHPEAITLRGIVYYLLERYEEALVDFNWVVELDGNHLGAITARGVTYNSLKRYEEASTDFSRAIELDGSSKWTFICRGEIYRRMQRYEEALVNFDRAIELDGTDTEALTGRGGIYDLLERYDEALIDFNRLLELDENDIWTLTRRGEVYYSVQRYEEAIADFSRAIELDKNDKWLFKIRGEAYQQIEQYEAALGDFDRAIELDPEYDWVIGKRAETYRRMQRYEAALVDFDRAIELDEEDDWAIASRGEVYLLIGQSDRAIQDLDRAIQIDPEDDWYRYGRAIAYLTLNQSANADIESAIHLAQAERSQNPNDWQNTLNLALYHLVAAQPEPAAALYQEAMASAPPAILREAIQDLEDLLRLLPNHQSAQEMLRSLNEKRGYRS